MSMQLRDGNVFIPIYVSVHRGSHVIITHDALDLTVQVLPKALAPTPRSRHWTSLYRDPMLVTSGGHHYRCVETCSVEEYPPTKN